VFPRTHRSVGGTQSGREYRYPRGDPKPVLGQPQSPPKSEDDLLGRQSPGCGRIDGRCKPTRVFHWKLRDPVLDRLQRDLGLPVLGENGKRIPIERHLLVAAGAHALEKLNEVALVRLSGRDESRLVSQEIFECLGRSKEGTIGVGAVTPLAGVGELLSY